MDFPKTYRTTLGWTMFTGTLIALIDGSGTLGWRTVVALAVIGAIGATWAAVEHGWLKRKTRRIVILILIWGGMAGLAYFVLPPPEYTHLRFLGVNFVLEGTGSAQWSFLNFTYDARGPGNVKGLVYLASAWETKDNTPLSDENTALAIKQILSLTQSELPLLNKNQTIVNPGEQRHFYSFPGEPNKQSDLLTSSYEDVVQNRKLLYFVTEMIYRDEKMSLNTYSVSQLCGYFQGTFEFYHSCGEQYSVQHVSRGWSLSPFSSQFFVFKAG